jgi:hypothetical protein
VDHDEAAETLHCHQGFYEWLKKGPGGKERVPHFVRRKDEELMCFAGLWDCVKYEDAEEKLYTYTIITTDSNQQLSFLHDRMPVILDAGSEAMKLWLDPERSKWSKELQSVLRPYKGDLQCYPVNKAVGRVGNNSADFIVPIDSKQNKSNIANFFGNPQKTAKDGSVNSKVKPQQDGVNGVSLQTSTENNAPLPMSPEKQKTSSAGKREHSPDQQTAIKTVKTTSSQGNAKRPVSSTPSTKPTTVTNRGTPTKKAKSAKPEDGVQTITNFFGK